MQRSADVPPLHKTTSDYRLGTGHYVLGSYGAGSSPSGLSLLICLACALPAFVGTSARAGALAPTLLDASGSMVSAYGGWAAWSRADLATNAYVLVLRSPKGAVSLAPIPGRASPFDVELGPDGPGVAAVYSRCSDIDKLEGCHIYELKLGVAGATEQMLEVPGSSVHEPAIWGGLLVFLRRNPGGGAHRPDNLFQWRIGSSPAHSVALPTSRGGLFCGGGALAQGPDRHDLWAHDSWSAARLLDDERLGILWRDEPVVGADR